MRVKIPVCEDLEMIEYNKIHKLWEEFSQILNLLS